MSKSRTDVCHTFNIPTTPNSIIIHIQNIAVRSLVDTGSELSLLNKKIYDSLRQKPPLKRGGVSLHSANGSHMEVKGKILLNFKIHGQKFQHEFFVVKDLTRSAIIGRDFLTKFNATIYCAYNKLKINNAYIPLENDTHFASTVRTTHNITLKPQTSCFLTARMKTNPYFSDDTDYSFNPAKAGFLRNQPEVQIVPALVKILDRRLPVQVMNNSNKTIRIKRGCVIGTLAKITEVNDKEREIFLTEVSETEFQSQIAVEEKHRGVVEPFVFSNKDLFAFSDLDLNVTDLGIAEIDTGDHRPINLRPYRIPLSQREGVSKTIDDLLEAGIISRSNSPWNFPIVLVEKKPDNPADPPKKRMCVDFRALNAIVDIRSHPIPLIDDILANLKGTTYFTTLDLRSGFHQIPLTEDASDRCAFSCFKGKYQYRVLPFGLNNAPSIFQQLVNKLLLGCEQYAMAYIDDILIYTKSTLEDHLKHVQIVMDRIRKHNLKLKLTKCQWAMEEIKYLGFIVNRQGISPCEDKVKAIKSLQPPENVRQVRGLLGMMSYYRRFIPRFAQIAEPLVGLTKKYARFQWSQECQIAFDQLKLQLTVVPKLAYPDINKEFTLYTDASHTTIGSVLVQKAEGEEWVKGYPNEKPVYFLSHKLSPTQIKYSTIEKELYAIHYSLQKLHFYLYNAKFTIKTDHQPLKYIFTAEQTNRRIQSWALNINTYNCSIEYLKGNENIIADLLSRSPPLENDDVDEDDAEMRDGAIEIATVSAVQTEPVADKAITREANQCPSDGADPRPQKSDGEVLEVAAINSNLIDPAEFLTVDQQEVQQVSSDPEASDHLLDNLDIVEEQMKDPDIRQLKHDLESKKTNTALMRSYMVHNKIVYYISQGDEDPILRLYVPEHLRDKIIKQYHDDNGHMGVPKCFKTIKVKYYWPNLYKHLSEKISNCLPCKERNLRQIKAPVQETGVPPYPMAVLQLDLSGPHKKSLSGNLYIASFICLYSGWLEAFAIPDKSAQSVVECLLEYILPRHSCCLAIQTDNGLEFVNKYFTETLERLNIKHLKTSTYSPRSNGAVERSHRTLNNLLVKLMGDHNDTWDLYLNTALMAMRTNVSQTTSSSPFKLLYNRDPVLPLDNLLMPREKTYSEDYHDVAYENLHKTFVEVLKNTKKTKQSRNKTANKNRAEKQLKVGDPVFLKNHTKSTKLEKNWLTHHTIVEKTGPVSFRVRNQLTGKESRVHADSLRFADITWKLPKQNGRKLRKTRLAASLPESSSPASGDTEMDISYSQTDDSEDDSEATVIYNVADWHKKGISRENKMREDTDEEDDIPQFELRRNTRTVREQTHDSRSDSDDGITSQSSMQQSNDEKKKRLTELVEVISNFL